MRLGAVYQGGIFSGGGMIKFSSSGGTTPITGKA